MPSYKGVSAETGLDVIRPNDSYRAVLDAARAVAQRFTGAVKVVNADDGTEVAIVHPDGRVGRL